MLRLLFISVVLCVTANGAILPKKAPRLNSRIIGGEDGEITDLPYQLALLYKGDQQCGATIISAKWALTGARCVFGQTPAKDISFRAGSNLGSSGGSIHQASRIIVHPNFLWYILDYDYALVEVSNPFPLGEPGVQAIGLADAEPTAGDEGTVSGWGTIDNTDPNFYERLQVVRVPIVNRATCVNLYRGYDFTERMFCAGDIEEGGKDPCQGDYGGPLVINGVLSGIASWGYGCGYAEYPGVYSKIAAQRNWIREISGV